MAKVFLGIPLYDKEINVAAAFVCFSDLCSKKHEINRNTQDGSLIPYACNWLWCKAMNSRQQGFDWFAMLHSDIQAPEAWIDILIDEAIKHDADFVSAVVPMRERLEQMGGGCTSTGISIPGHTFKRFCRLTQAQVRHEYFPGTFDIHLAADALERLPDQLRMSSVPREFLLCNTGCMVCRLDRPWCDGAYFDNPNEIGQHKGKYLPLSLPEDWFFTRRIAELGGKVMATKLVRVKHCGLTDFDSHEVWGKSRDVN